MSLNEALLHDVYHMHYQEARKKESIGQYVEAKKYYLLAAESLLKLAKIGSDSLKTIRIRKAKSISDYALQLNISSYQYPQKNEVDSSISRWKPVQTSSLSFDDIAGLDDIKHLIKVKMIFPILHEDTYKLYQKKIGGGMMLYGPPGTGKTMIARAIAHEVDAPFYVVKPSDILSKYVGESENHIKDLFNTLKKEKRAVLFFDELDGLFKKRGQDEHNDRRIAEFLQHMDGFEEKNNHLLILGATNRPWDVDEAARRPGRFSESIYVPLPDQKGRRFIIEKSIATIPKVDNIDLDKLILLTNGYTGADLEELCDYAKEFPLMRSIQSHLVESMTMDDFMLALTKIKPSVSNEDLHKFELFMKM